MWAPGYWLFTRQWGFSHVPHAKASATASGLMHARGSLGEAQAPWLSLGPVIHQHVARSQCQPYLEMKGPGTRTVLQTGTAQILKFNYQPTQPPAAARKKNVFPTQQRLMG